MVHIGSKIKEGYVASGWSVTYFAKQIHCSRQNVYRIFCRESVDTNLLDRIGKALNHDFFQYYVNSGESPQRLEALPNSEKEALMNKMEKEFAQLNEKFEALREEVRRKGRR